MAAKSLRPFAYLSGMAMTQMYCCINTGWWFVDRWLVVLRFTRRWLWMYRTECGQLFNSMHVFLPPMTFTSCRVVFTHVPAPSALHPRSDTCHPNVLVSCYWTAALVSPASDTGQHRDVTSPSKTDFNSEIRANAPMWIVTSDTMLNNFPGQPTLYNLVSLTKIRYLTCLFHKFSHGSGPFWCSVYMDRTVMCLL